ncbi:alpha/beta hydrolase [Sphaerotilaceae bacterium SBD11-9]
MNTSLNLPPAALAAHALDWLANHFAHALRKPVALDSSMRTACPDEVSFASRDGRARVHASLLQAPRAESAVVIVVGQVGCWGSDARIEGRSLHVRTMAQALRARGITVLVARMRGHGESERHDVLGAIDYLRSRGYRPGCIGVLGASMGASAALLAAAEEPAVCAVVADSPRGAAHDAVQSTEGGVMLPLARWMGRLLSGVDIGQRPLLGSLSALHNRAVLIVQGRGDRVVTPAAAQALAKACGARLWLTASQTHAGTLHEALPLYITRVVDFFSQHLLPPASEPALVPGLAPVWGGAAA